MKTTSIKIPFVLLSCLLLISGFSVSSISYAGDKYHVRHWDAEKTGHEKHHNRWDRWNHARGFDRGHHKGHHNGRGRHKGHDHERNPWYSFYKDKFDNEDPEENTGVNVDITFHDRAINPGTTFNATYNSLVTIEELLTDLVGDPEGYVLRECFETGDPIQGIVNDCEGDETMEPMDNSLTLEAAGIVEDPEVYLDYTGQ